MSKKHEKIAKGLVDALSTLGRDRNCRAEHHWICPVFVHGFDFRLAQVPQ